MNATATDRRDAWARAKEFLDTPTETTLSLQMDSEYSKELFTIVKLPYGKHIDLLYAFSWHEPRLHPGLDLRYAGFYSRQHKQSYHIREPLSRIFEFDGKPVYEGDLQKMVVSAVQSAAAGIIVDLAKNYKEFNYDGLDDDIKSYAEAAFSKRDTVLDFSKKIRFDGHRCSESAYVELIDNPGNIGNPESLLKRYVDDVVFGHEEELARLWYAHLTAQKLLDRLYAESEGGTGDE
jgi:hypothetical protein